jgi:hypothetical protein
MAPTPYLKKHWAKLIPATCNRQELPVMDIGCGNGRNLKFMRQLGCTNSIAFDMAGDYGHKLILGEETFPVLNNSVSVILANYVFMFLDKKERNQVIGEITRMAKPDCRIMIELYPAKDSFAPTEKQCTDLQKELFRQLGWEKILYSKRRFIATKTV